MKICKHVERVWYWAHPRYDGYSEIIEVTEYGFGEAEYEVIKIVNDYAEADKIARSMY